MDGGHASKLTIASTCAASARATGSAAERPSAVSDGLCKGSLAVHRRKDVARHRISPSQDRHRNQPRTAEAYIWAGVCAELANRGAKDVPIVYCGGLSGFPEAIEATLLDEGASPAEVITKHVEHWQRN